MKALVYSQYGGPEVLAVRDCSSPEPGADEVVVKIHAAGVNPFDWKMREGWFRSRFAPQFPHIPGRDFSGLVEAVGENVRDLKVGDAVFGVADPVRPGSHAEKIAIKANIVASKPMSLTHMATAALGLASLTALAALEAVAQVRSGMRILIHAGAGGVGHLAIQYARSIGAHVITTARDENRAFVQSCGAQETVDHTQVDFVEKIQDCDVVFDTIGGEVHRRSMQCLRRDGLLAYLNAAPRPEGKAREDIRVTEVQVPITPAALQRVGQLAAEEVFRPHISATFPLGRAPEAYALSQTGHTRGKSILVTI